LGKSTTTDENGFFRIEGIPVNSEGYSLKISKKCYLLRTVEFRSGGEDIQFDEENMPISMWVGDIVMDEAINIVDIMEIAKSYNSFSGDAKYNKDVDINKDGAVNIQDIMIVAANFNKVSSNYNNNEIILLRKMKLHIGNITRMIFKENLSEGLKWDYEIENENIIKFESGYIEELVAGDPFANHVWRFTAVAEGESYLTFKSSLGQIEKYLIIVSNPLSSSTPSP
jgi:predicted secreted protein